MNYPPRRPRRAASHKESRTRFDVALQQRRAAVGAGPRLSRRARTAIVLLVLLVGGAVLGWSWYWGEAWRVHAVYVRNNTGVPVDRVIAASGLQGEHTQQVDLNAAAARIDELPGIEAAQIDCSWDGLCEVAIKETTAVAVWQSGAGQVWVDGESKVQLLEGKAAAPDALIVRVESGSLPSTEKQLAPHVMRALNELKMLQPAVRQYTYSPEFGFAFSRGGFVARLGTSDYEGAMRDKLNVLQKIETWLAEKNTQARVIDVRFIEAPFYQK